MTGRISPGWTPSELLSWLLSRLRVFAYGSSGQLQRWFGVVIPRVGPFDPQIGGNLSASQMSVDVAPQRSEPGDSVMANRRRWAQIGPKFADLPRRERSSESI